MFDDKGGAAVTLVDRITAASREENRAAGARLAAIGELDAVRAREGVIDEHWVIDRTNAVAAEVSAALSVSAFVAHGFVHYARAMRDRLPRVGGLLTGGVISYWTFTTIVLRTDLIDDVEVIATVDATLAARIGRWSSLTRGRLAGYVDKLVARLDRDALRQRREFAAERAIAIADSTRGLSTISGWLLTTDAHVLDARLTALAGTVCDDDPRTVAQRRADALGALATGAQRLACRCERSDCPAGGKRAPAPAVIYVIAEQASLDGAGEAPGSLVDADALIPAELLADLAVTARRRPLIHPGGAPPESGYVPSAGLADFVRCRDLTCRFPGCDVPAMRCDIDHTVPHAEGGATHASNLKCECRTHHLLKTFGGWRDQQLPDGTVIWRAPSGHTYVTTPGSALLFPQLCVPTGHLDAPEPTPDGRCGQRTAMMPRRRRTRAENHARYIAAERRRNRQTRLARRRARQAAWTTPAPRRNPDDDPPPF